MNFEFNEIKQVVDSHLATNQIFQMALVVYGADGSKTKFLSITPAQAMQIAAVLQAGGE